MSQPAYNHLPQVLKNHYVIQRHGFSLANNAGLICSNPDIAIPATGGPLNTGYGLHDKGKLQVKESAARLSKHLFPTQQAPEGDEPVVMFCSPFKRTVETAEITRGVLNEVLGGKIKEPTRNIELRERWFGKFDMTSDENYNLCYVDDASPTHGENSPNEVESPSHVCDRATKFILEEIENKMEGKIVILVAHGDVCQILVSAFMRREAWRHREMEHVETASWRDTLAL